MQNKIIITILLFISAITNAQLTEVSSLSNNTDPDNQGLVEAFTHNSNKLIFSVYKNSNYYLYATDGANISELRQMQVITSGYPKLIEVMGDTFYFFGIDHNGNTGRELWKTDGTVSGTNIVKDINSGNADGTATDVDFCVTDNLIFSVADDGSEKRLWKSDGTQVNTSMVKIIEQANSTDDIRHFYAFNNEAYFSAYTNSYGLELWKSNGTATGTVMVKDINPGTAPRTPYGRSADPNDFFAYNNTLYFSAEKEGYGVELWKTDGTEANTVMIKDINSGTSSSYPKNFFSFNNEIYFTANTASNGIELWKTDGTNSGTILVKDIYPGTGGAIRRMPPIFNIINNQLYFMAESTYNRLAIWKTDGTESGTIEIAPISLGNYSKIVSYHNKLYFSANDAKAMAQQQAHIFYKTLM